MTIGQRLKALALVSLIMLTAGSVHGDPLTTLREAREAAQARDNARLSALLEDREALQAALGEAREAHQKAQREQQALAAQQAQQQALEQELDALQQEQGADFDRILSALSQHSSGLRDSLNDSWITLGETSLPPRLDENEVLESRHIEQVVDSLMALTAETARVVRLEAEVADADGMISQQEIIRLGDFAAFSESDLLQRGEGEGTLSVAPRTPPDVAETLAAFHAGESRTLAIDPTQGQVIAAMAQQPSLLERFHQGGAVGYVVVTLGIFGLLVALLQYVYLLGVTFKVRRQRRQLDALSDNNPLGRVLLRFQAMDSHQVPEALEARLDEAVLAELPRLERGQPIVKLLAAVAPLLGLLGTVTGMIVTFQAITVFGTGDPQMMAGGISQALVTTVLGLVTAVPLLFAQTALSGRSRYLANVVEGQASATLAEHLEARLPHQPRTVNEDANVNAMA
ncbi:MotA/TolQ/ExbB proton channel family protein [Halomonas sp. ZH2S]|uniref:MotA/TolQ/ExbB proton channel family protein n=1 Tax=Vreelandella zhuhanensis TaxID=2684210 RepID=A0A7X3GY88_9GAMM|nr:MotA/TolQ/ExbB proton channel family protein [Halomonas zhuhanensis]MWJ26769.1 MotA/TolQ/ExbB proton channel family protein [Halomonas zhuhanensis]